MPTHARRLYHPLLTFVPPHTPPCTFPALHEAQSAKVKQAAAARASSGAVPITYEPSGHGDGSEVLAIGDAKLTVPQRAAHPELVPRPLFYDIPRCACACIGLVLG